MRDRHPVVDDHGTAASSERPRRFARGVAPLREAGVIALYLAFSLAVTWPLARDFTTRLVGVVLPDQLHAIWLISNFRDWVTGNAPLFFAPSLYSPFGTTLLLDGVGPVSGLLALPFWSGGPIAAYNGAVLVGFTLSGYFMYLLARGCGLSRAIAVFSGVLLVLAAPHMVSLYGHLERSFVGLPPLALLGALHAMDPRRSSWWALFAAVMLLLCALYTASQLVFAGFAIAVMLGVTLFRAPPAESGILLRRAGLLAACTAAVVVPYVAAVMTVARDPAYHAALGRFAAYYAPDAAQFVIPSEYSQYLGWIKFDWRETRPRAGMDIPIETAVSVPWTAILLVIVAMGKTRERARPWVIASACLAVLSLGPSLRLLGDTRFSAYNLPVILPYAFLASVPGLDVMRVPGRFMIVGMATIAVAAGLGLHVLMGNARPARRWGILAAALLLAAFEQWPRPWQQRDIKAMYPLPPFYARLATDDGHYGVLDLPVPWPPDLTQSVYQWHQLTHRKPIAWGYLSRSYVAHPIALLQQAMQPVASSGLRTGSGEGSRYRHELRRLRYRYVVWHKTYPEMPGVLPTPELIAFLFGPEPAPVFEDELVRVFELTP